MNYFNYTQYQQPSVDERIWVQGRSSAEAYLMTPNSFVRLWDSNKPVFYEKRTDATGRPIALDVYEYRVASPEVDISTKEDEAYKMFVDELEGLKSRISALENKGNKKKEVQDE